MGAVEYWPVASYGTDADLGDGLTNAPPGLVGLVAGRAGPHVLTHSLRVARGAGRVAGAYGMDPGRLELMSLAGVVHDVGKALISRRVLDKPGPLSDAEWKEIRRHPAAGARLLRAYELPEVAAWVLAHHERPDGRGYPHGLHGEEIPLEARILAVVDAYDAMTAVRTYRPRLGAQEAAAELRRAAGSQLDATAVSAFLDSAA